jgi:hypothetical protein
MYLLDAIFYWWTLALVVVLLVLALKLKNVVSAVLAAALAIQADVQNILVYRTLTPPIEWDARWGANVAMLVQIVAAVGYTVLAVRLFKAGSLFGKVFGCVALVGVNVSLDMFTSALHAALRYAHQTTVANTPLWLIGHVVFYAGIAAVLVYAVVRCWRWIMNFFASRPPY